MKASAAPAPRPACRRARCTAWRLLAVLLLLSAAATGQVTGGSSSKPQPPRPPPLLRRPPPPVVAGTRVPPPPPRPATPVPSLQRPPPPSPAVWRAGSPLDPPRQQQARPAFGQPRLPTTTTCPAAPPVDCKPAPRGSRVAPTEAAVLLVVLLPDVPCCAAFDQRGFERLLQDAAMEAGASQPPTIRVQLIATSGGGGGSSSSDEPADCTLAKLAAQQGTLVQARVDFDDWYNDAAAASCFYRTFLLETYDEAEGQLVVQPAAPVWLHAAFGPSASVARVSRAAPLSFQQSPPPSPAPSPAGTPPGKDNPLKP